MQFREKRKVNTRKWIKLILVVLVIASLPVAIAAAAGNAHVTRGTGMLVRGQANTAPAPLGPKSGVDILPRQNPLQLPEPNKGPIPNMPVTWKEGWEYAWPNATWATFDNNGGWDMCWDDVPQRHKKGGWSAWPGDGCPDGWSPANGYDYNMESWMTLGPVSTSGAKKGTLTFYYWLDTEYGYDWFWWCASVDGSQYYCKYISGYSANKWLKGTLDLKNVPGYGNMLGYPQVWVGFIFTSDDSFNYEGVYVDEMTLAIK